MAHAKHGFLNPGGPQETQLMGDKCFTTDFDKRFRLVQG
jgi:hypothetical protein